MQQEKQTKQKKRVIKAANQTTGEVKCSITDHILKNLPIPVVFFYKESIQEEIIINAFEEVFNDFPVYTGRLKPTEEQLVIQCTNEGASFSSEHLDITLDELAKNFPEHKRTLADVINPEEANMGQSPLFTVSVKYLSCGGMSLGLCWHHSLGDMHSFVLFIQAFAKKVEGKEYTRPLGITDRHAYLLEKIKKNANPRPGCYPMKFLKKIQLILYMLFKAKKKTTLRFYFSDNELAEMKAHYSKQTALTLSTNDILTAYIERAISSAEKRKKERIISLTVNYRKHEELPDNLCGNYLSSQLVSCKPGDRVVTIAEKMRKGLNNYKEHYFNYQVQTEYIRDKIGFKQLDNVVSRSFDPVAGTILTTNWNKFPNSDIKFGTVKPFFFTGIGSARFTHLSSFTKGFNEQGLIYNITLPDSLAKKIKKPAVLERLHRFRKEPDQTMNAQMPWLL